MATLFEGIRWQTRTLSGHAATPRLELSYGEVGERGPLATLVAGVHGDEGPWGALAVRKLLGHPQACLRGRLRVILAANPLAAEADARNAPLDSLDLNRSFPGNSEGSHTERLAAELAPLVADSDIVIDLHGGGSWCVNAFAFRFPGSEHLAEAIGAPVIVDVPEKPGTLTQYAGAQGAKVLALEMGGRSRDEMYWRTRIADGLARVLTNEKVLGLEPAPAQASLKVGPTQVLRPANGGIFVPTLREEAVGTLVEEGCELGRVLDLYSLEEKEVFRAPFSQTALLLLRPHIGVIEGGAMTYVVAEPKEGV